MPLEETGNDFIHIASSLSSYAENTNTMELTFLCRAQTQRTLQGQAFSPAEKAPKLSESQR